MALLRGEFPFLTFVELPGYDIKFDKNRAFTVFRLVYSIPKILIRIKRETAWLKAFSDREKPDLVISDNRYGLHFPGTYSVFVTHQLRIVTPFGSLADRLLQWINYRLIDRFSCCWIPDVPGDAGLAGELSHPAKMPHIPHCYIGWLSRFSHASVAENNYLLALLSGPEPQRTLLEKIILEQAAATPHSLVLVRGLPEGGPPVTAPPGGLIIHDHLPAAELEELIRGASVVIARPGYSTLMDLTRLKKRAVVVPTPGQSEQEYLGKHLAAKGLVACIRQRDFSLAAAQAAHRLSIDGENSCLLTAAIAELLRQSWPPALGKSKNQY